MSELIKKAEELARGAHDGQFRKDGVTPYIEHPAQLAKLVSEFDDENATAAAWLHDVVEDTDTALDTIELATNRDVRRMVFQLTTPEYDKAKMPRDRRKFYDRMRLAVADFDVQRIKMLDRIINLQDMKDADYFKADFKDKYGRESIDLVNAMVRNMDPTAFNWVEDMYYKLKALARGLIQPIVLEGSKDVDTEKA